MKKILPEVVVLCAILMVVRYGFAQTWTQTSATVSVYQSITESADGRMIMAVSSSSTVRSTNWGVTWNVIDSGFSYDVRSSADGSKLIRVAAGGWIIVSTNSGVTWAATSLSNRFWVTCASSADGTKLAAAYTGISDGLIYTSTNSGATWLANTAPSNSWGSLASSADGTKLAAIAQNAKIYTSTNSGLTWVPTSAPSNNWGGIASSADGNRLVVGSVIGIFISTNSGGSWTSNSVIARGSAACSSDGSKLVVCNTNGQIYISTNYGISWISNNIVGNRWSCVASSADGNRLFAAEYGGSSKVWTYQVTPSPKLNVAPANTNVALSWLVPSTNFVLEQSSDLTTADWVTLTNTPVLNLTNLNNEVTLSPSNSGGFFRLMTQ